MYQQEISFERANEIAEELAYTRLNKFRDNPDTPLLSSDFLEAECCWFFFRNRDIPVLERPGMIWNCAYAISKKGEVSIIGDFSDDPDKLSNYLQAMSYYFKSRNV